MLGRLKKVSTQAKDIGQTLNEVLILKYIFFLLCTCIFNAYAGDPMAFVCEDDCSSSDPLTSGVLIAIIVVMVYFGWLIWGLKSIKIIYIPVFVGCLVIFFIDSKIRSYFFLPIAGFIIGWVLIFIATIFFNFDYFKNDPSNSSAPTLVKNKDGFQNIPNQIQEELAHERNLIDETELIEDVLDRVYESDRMESRKRESNFQNFLFKNNLIEEDRVSVGGGYWVLLKEEEEIVPIGAIKILEAIGFIKSGVRLGWYLGGEYSKSWIATKFQLLIEDGRSTQ
jgi:hypothetical protein